MEILKIAQIIIAVLLMLSILIQSRGTGLSGIFGGEGNVYRARRGFEKNIFVATIVLAVSFLAISLLSVIL